MSDAFSPIMIVGALRLPEVIEGMIEASTTRKASSADHARLGIDNGATVVARAHPARPARVIGALGFFADERVDVCVAQAICAGLDLAAAIGIEGFLREYLARQANAGAHFRQSSGSLI